MNGTELKDVLQARSRAIADRARGYVDASVGTARHSTTRLADLIEGLERPVKTLSTAGTRFTQVSQRYAAELVTAQALTVETALEDGAARLRLVAKADGFRPLVRAQIERLSTTRDEVKEHVRRAADATTAAGRELSELAKSTYGDLVHGKPATQAKRGKQAAAKKKTSTRGKTTRTKSAAKRKAA